ncbi:PREDICTED: protein TIFY 6B isoform X2 [Tarenaya hassleriana]|nr:PREDICTED: protein TIFY 6B isoform X2 [Tarenaya hassleriana]
MKWAFSNKASTVPQFLSFRPSQEDRPRKSANGHSVPSGPFVPTSIADVLDSNRKTSYSSVQELRTFPTSNQQNQTITVSMTVPAFQSHFTSGGKSFISSTINPQPLGGVPIMAPPVSVLPAPSPVVGTTDIRSSSKPLGSPAQLTIFYAGSVCVYDDISPEKAQAIMLLAGNGSSVPQNKPLATPQAQQQAPRLPTPLPAPPPLVPAFSYVGSEAVVGELGAAKTMGGSSFASNNNQIGASRMSCSVPTNIITAVGLPQARKASLARFLEKRKERVTSTSPYCVERKASTPMSECISSSVSSATSAHLH